VIVEKRTTNVKLKGCKNVGQRGISDGGTRVGMRGEESGKRVKPRDVGWLSAEEKWDEVGGG